MFGARLLYLSEQPRVFSFVRGNRLARHFASRFVAGETLETAVPVVRELNGRGITASLDLLGESVTSAAESRAAAATVVQTLDRIASERLDCNVSVKLTQMGLDLDVAATDSRLRPVHVFRGPPHQPEPQRHDQRAALPHDQHRPRRQVEHRGEQVALEMAVRRACAELHPQHTRQQIDGERESVHLRKQRDDEGREHSQ